MQTRKTFQKSLTLEAVRELKSHPTADEVYTFVSKQYPDISRATVYRNLNYLCETGSVYRVRVADGADHFDYQTTPHYHFRCSSCGCVTDVAMPYMENLNGQCEKANGSSVTEHQVFFSGFCADCNKKSQ
ncbi:MAG: transcriptional repressor [Oscillospiraceae bacterium]